MMPEPPPRPDTGLPLPPVSGSQVRSDLDGRPLATWRWWEVLGMVFAGYFLGTIASIPVYAIMKDTTSNGANGPSELLQGVVVNAVLLATLALWLRRRHPTWRQIIGFPSRSNVMKEIAIGAGLGLLVRIVAGIASTIVVSLLTEATGETVRIPEQVREGMSATALVLFALYAVIVAPVTEEFVFRGLLYRSIRDRIGVAAGAILAAIPFGLVHFVPGQPWADVVALQMTMVVTGIGLALVYERRRNLLANVAGHAAFNLLAVIMIVSGSAFVPGFLR